MPPKMRSPLLGYNHNLKYKGRVYHVQTEDSGVRQPHVFTHLFYDGTILATKKTDYAHLLDAPDSEKQVRGIMQRQHKDMMKELLRGVHDEAIFRLFGVVDAEEAKSPVGDVALEGSTADPSMQHVAEPAAADRPLVSGDRPSQSAGAVTFDADSAVHRPAKPVASDQEFVRSDVPPSRAPGVASAQPARRRAMEQPEGSSVVMVAPVVVVTDIGASPSRQHRSQTVPRLPAMGMDGASGRPSDPRSSQEQRKRRHSETAEFRPEESRTIPPTVFTDGVVEDEEGLDEVILQYLAEDLPDE